MMAEDKDLRKLLKKIDTSDIRLLVIGVALLIVPAVFLFSFPGQC